MEIHFDVERGVISRCQIFSDSLNPAPLEALAQRMQNVTYRPDALEHVLSQLVADFPAQQAELTELQQWLIASLR